MRVLFLILIASLISCTATRLSKPLTPCGAIPKEIREKILKGETPGWVIQKYKTEYNTVEKASIELLDIKCSEMIFVDAWLKGETLFVRVQRYSLINDIEIGIIPGIQKAWVVNGKLFYTYNAVTFWDKLRYGLYGFFTGGGFVAVLFLAL